MRLLHLADLHIGKVINEFSMLEDQKYVLQQVIEMALEEQTEGVILAGDIYDRSVPTAEAVCVLNEFLEELAGIGQKIFVISGNHDSPERISFAGNILSKSGVYMEGGFGRVLKKVSLTDEYGPVNVFFLPFAREGAMRKALGLEGGAGMTGCLKKVIENTKLDLNERNILITHHFVTAGEKEPELSDSEYPLSAGGIENIDASVFDGFDYTALGHIHKPQSIGSERVCYAGSLLKYSFSECGSDKSAVIVELKEKGELSIRRRALQPAHDLRKIRGELKELLKEETMALADREDYLFVTLTDEKELFEPMEQLRRCYPNVMQLELEKNTRHEGEAAALKEKHKKKTLMEIYSDFYEAVTDRALDAPRKEILLSIIKEIREEKE